MVPNKKTKKSNKNERSSEEIFRLPIGQTKNRIIIMSIITVTQFKDKRKRGNSQRLPIRRIDRWCHVFGVGFYICFN